uniref:Palmitoyltransferase n=1 Tax=Tetranychus urticae TaxID=32264 RepID=T1K928_TETUR
MVTKGDNKFDSEGYAPIHWVSKFGSHDTCITAALLENSVSASIPAKIVCGPNTKILMSYVQPNSLEYKKVLEAKLESASKLKEEIKKFSESKSKERIKLPGIPYFSVKLCHTCKIIQEIGTKHCSYCNRCIANHDHHCIYLNNCISSYNRILFIALTFSLAVTGSSLIIILYISLQKTNYKVNWRQFGLFLLALNLCFNGGLKCCPLN